VTCAESIVYRFITPQKTRQPAVLLNRVKLVAPTRKYLMSVGLMADVPNKAIIRGVENVMHCHRKFNGTKASSCVAADPGTSFQNELPYFIRDLLQILEAKLS
jgi:hypothetical protein